MKAIIFRRTVFAALALVLAVLALPLAASAKQADPFIQLVATDVTLDETRFEYTGSEIRPNVTVRVNGQLLTLDQDYYLDYADNVEVGEAKVIVTGIATAGYAGTVEHPFFIVEKQAQPPQFTLVELKGTDVTISGTRFPYTGQAIEPSVTVTVEGKTLEQGRDYAVEYVNNLVPGTGTVIVRGIATASETLGYTGEVRMDFTILPPEEQTPSQPTQPEETEPEETKPEETKPEETKPEETQPESPAYKITRGSGTSWYQGSTGGLSFTADGEYADFTGVSVNGKLLDKKHYSAKEGTTVLLKNGYLKELKEGDYTIAIHFEDGDAQGTFHIEGENANPKTGDTIHLAAAVLFISLTGLAGTAVACRKKLWK